MLTDKQKRILDYLKAQGGACSPSDIGMNVGAKPYSQASSWACQGLKGLCKAGLVKRTDKGHYEAV